MPLLVLCIGSFTHSTLFIDILSSGISLSQFLHALDFRNSLGHLSLVESLGIYSRITGTKQLPFDKREMTKRVSKVRRMYELRKTDSRGETGK